MGNSSSTLLNLASGSSIALTSDLTDDQIHFESDIHLYGLNQSEIRTLSIDGRQSQLIFENIIFRNVDSRQLHFQSGHFIFKNCTFHLQMDIPADLFGIHLADGSAEFRACTFHLRVCHCKLFSVIGIERSSQVRLYSPVIRVKYSNVQRLDTYFYSGSKDACLESFSGSIHYQSLSPSLKAHIRLFRGINSVHANLNSTSIYLIDGHGDFDLASGDDLIYVNALTVAAQSDGWRMGEFHNILLTSFMSNLQSACEVKSFSCLKDSSSDSSF